MLRWAKLSRIWRDGPRSVRHRRWGLVTSVLDEGVAIRPFGDVEIWVATGKMGGVG